MDAVHDGRAAMNRTNHRRRIAARSKLNVNASRNERRGAVLVAVVVCLAVALAMITAMAACMMLTQRQVRRQAVADQSHFLCEAAAERAFEKIKDDPKFEDDVWEIPASELGDRGAAKVTVHVESAPDGKRTLEIATHFPVGSNLEMETTRTITIE